MAVTQDDESGAAKDDQFGRDELNICEFPISLLTDRPPDGIRTVTYTDRIPDRSSGQMIDRKVTVTGSDLYGLSTATDADVLIALIQHTRITNNFTASRVPFSRYELINILGWNKEGYSYRRVAQSLRRWKGITIYFDQSWRDKARRMWSSHSMSILNDVYINSSLGRRAEGSPDDQNCWYSWGEKMFESLQAGNLKRLDLDMYFSLNSAIAKFMYRYLDKHFYKRQELRLDLATFAYEKLGMSRKYKLAQVKHKLQAAIQELVDAGFIMAANDRYDRTNEGWSIYFTKNARSTQVVEDMTPKEVYGVSAMRLMEYGVTKRVAIELASKNSEEEITKHIQGLLWKQKKAPGAVKDQAAYLVSAIDQNWSIPDGLVKEAKAQEKKVVQESVEDEARKRKAAQKAEEDRIQAFWDEMDGSAQEKFYQEAIDALPQDEKEALLSYRPVDPAYKLLKQGAKQRLIRIKLGLDPEN